MMIMIFSFCDTSGTVLHHVHAMIYSCIFFPSPSRVIPPQCYLVVLQGNVHHVVLKPHVRVCVCVKGLMREHSCRRCHQEF